MIPPRIQGATAPGYSPTFTTATDGDDYTWTCQATAKDTPWVELWEKTTGITSSANGFDVVWDDTDLGALEPGHYVLEFTGTGPAGVLKFQERVTILPDIP